MNHTRKPILTIAKYSLQLKVKLIKFNL